MDFLCLFKEVMDFLCHNSKSKRIYMKNLFDIEEEPVKKKLIKKKSTEMIVPAQIVKGRFSTPSNPDSAFHGLTKNNVQISDVFMLFAQRALQEEINEKEIYDLAMDRIQPMIKKHGLDLGNTRDKTRENQKIITSLLSQEIKKEVGERFQGKNSITIDFVDFVDRLNIASLYRKESSAIRLHVLYKIMTEARSNAVLKCRMDNWREDGDTLVKETDYIEYHLIPSFTIVVAGHEKEGEHFETFEELVHSRKRDKEKYIKAVKFNFNIEALAVFALPRIEDGYSITDREYRHGFSQYAFQLDWLVRSIYKVQHMESINQYPLEELYSIFGVNYAKYADFKRRVLLPAIKEINKAGAIFVEMKEHKENRKVKTISFSVKKKINQLEKEITLISDFSLSYFISVQHFHKDIYVKDDLTELLEFNEYHHEIKEFTTLFFKNRVKKVSNEETDLTLQQWKYLYETELSAWKRLIEIFDKNKERVFKLGYTLSDEKLGFIDIQTKRYIKPLKMEELGELTLPSQQVSYFTQLWGN